MAPMTRRRLFQVRIPLSLDRIDVVTRDGGIARRARRALIIAATLEDSWWSALSVAFVLRISFGR